MTSLVIVALLLSLPVAAQKDPTQLLPKDEAAQNPSFLAFRNRLMQAVKTRDKTFIRSILDENVKLTFGGDEGREAFERVWQPDNPRSNFWENMEKVLLRGGVFDREGRFTAPYVFALWPDAYDPFAHVAVIADKARLRAAPRTTAPVVATLSYDIVKLADDPLDPKTEAPAGWALVETLDGRKGYISEALIRSPIDYRAFFEPRDGHWIMTIFIAGD